MSPFVYMALGAAAALAAVAIIALGAVMTIGYLLRPGRDEGTPDDYQPTVAELEFSHEVENYLRRREDGAA